jgi:poly(3-hydroxybutyrate) depolymerase
MANETRGQLGALAIAGGALIVSSLCMMGCSGTEATSTGTRGTGGGASTATGTGTGGAATGNGTGATGGTGGSTTSGAGGATGGAGGATTGTGGSTGGTGGSTGGTGGTIADAGKPTDAGGTIADAAGSTGCGAATWPASGNFNIDVAGTQRQYIVKVPANYDTNRPYRLIMTWHGLGGTAAQVAGGRGPYGGYYGLDALAGGTAIFVSGQGLGPDGGAGWPNTGGQDVAFTRALVDWLRKSYCVDNARIFSVGMSYGGIMSNTLGCSMGDTFRAITPQSGSGPRGTCVGQVAVWISHGNADETVAFTQGTASRDFWLKANHCGTTTTPANPSPCVSYEGCDPGKPVTWCEFDGGHVIQNWAPQGIWNFLSVL